MTVWILQWFGDGDGQILGVYDSEKAANDARTQRADWEGSVELEYERLRVSRGAQRLVFLGRDPTPQIPPEWFAEKRRERFLQESEVTAHDVL